MTWTSPTTLYDITWVDDSDVTTEEYSAVTQTTITWQQLSSITDSDGGVDFVLKVDDQFPILVDDSRPAYVIEPTDAARP